MPHESTCIEGRGTEEVKTNDVSGRVKVGEVGFTMNLIPHDRFARESLAASLSRLDLKPRCYALSEFGKDGREGIG